MTLKEIFLDKNLDIIYPIDDIHHNEVFSLFPLIVFIQQMTAYGFYLNKSTQPWTLNKVAVTAQAKIIASIPYRDLKHISEQELAKVLEEVYNYCLDHKIFHVYCVKMIEGQTVLYSSTGFEHLYENWILSTTKTEFCTVGDYLDLKRNRDKINIWKSMVA